MFNLFHCHVISDPQGNVFLETYDPQEYDPLLLNIKMQQVNNQETSVT